MDKAKKNYIFFLQLQPLDQCTEFFVLAKLFARKGFQLVPVTSDELSELTQDKDNFLLVLTLNLSSFKKFNLKRKKFINFALKSRKLSLFHLNSFGEIKELSSSYKIKDYKSVSPPVSYDHLVDLVVEYFLHKMSKVERWPGGRRARLPEVN